MSIDFKRFIQVQKVLVCIFVLVFPFGFFLSKIYRGRPHFNLTPMKKKLEILHN